MDDRPRSQLREKVGSGSRAALSQPPTKAVKGQDSRVSNRSTSFETHGFPLDQMMTPTSLSYLRLERQHSADMKG